MKKYIDFATSVIIPFILCGIVVNLPYLTNEGLFFLSFIFGIIWWNIVKYIDKIYS